MDWQAIIIIVGPVGIYLDNIHETMRFVHRHHRLINGADRRNEIGQINLEEIKVVGGQLGSGIGGGRNTTTANNRCPLILYAM